MEFTIRPLTGVNGLDGVFRVHISSKDLEALRIKPGDLCQLQSADGLIAAGIAWRSTDPVGKTNARHVKVTDAFRELYKLTLTTQVTITKSTTPIQTATRVFVKDTIEQNSTDGTLKEDDILDLRIKHALAIVDGIAAGVEFSVPKRRFSVERIIVGGDSTTSLCQVKGSTEIVIHGSSMTPETVLVPAPKLPARKIRGLDDQLSQLLSRTLELDRGSSGISNKNSILLFGPTGVGKTMLIQHIARKKWKQVLHISELTMVGTSSKIRSAIITVFSEALSHEPSMIILDDLHSTLATDNSVAATLASQFDLIQGRRVLIIGATSDLASISDTLRRPGRLYHEMEVSPPTQQTRTEILGDLHDSELAGSAAFDQVAAAIGERTHGYTCADLVALYSQARDIAERAARPKQTVECLDALLDEAMEKWHITSDGDNPEPLPPAEPVLKHFETAMLQIRPTAMKEVIIDVPNVKWSDIGGCEDVRDLLTKAVEWPLKSPQVLKEYGMSQQKGVLLYGPPGCSKTMTAQALATSSGLNFLAVKGAELISMYVGESERAVRKVFRKARAAAPSILFFDEIDSIGGDRGGGSAHSGLNVLTTLLNEMDGIEALAGVLVLAATNRPAALDPALLRPGRFDNVIYVGAPDAAARQQILDIGMARYPCDRASLDLDGLVRRTEGFSGADVANVCRNAAKARVGKVLAPKEEGKGEVTREVCAEDFEEAMRETRSSIPADMLEEFARWRKGLS